MEQNREPRNKPMSLWSWLESHEINPCLWLIFDKGGKQTYDVVKTVSSINGVGITGLVVCAKKMKLHHQLTTYTRINSKWIEALNRSHDTIKVLSENIGSKISYIPCSNIFANISPRSREIKEKLNKWDYIKWRSFCSAKDTNDHVNEKATKCMGECTCHWCSDKVLIFNIRGLSRRHPAM